jgi:hypothetical protein
MWPYWELLLPENRNEAGLVKGLAEDDIMAAIAWAAAPISCITIMGFNLVADFVQPF